MLKAMKLPIAPGKGVGVSGSGLAYECEMGTCVFGFFP